MMKESDSPSSKMLNRNWVLKRKRRKLPSGPDVSNGKEKASKPLDLPSNDSPKCRVKNEVTSSHSSGKKKGNDGYYYECVVCDLGGNLLCCESCPRTYHIQCLDPPLKRIPTGKWECPTCCRKNDTQESVDPLDMVSKRARTKVTGGKAKNEKKSSGTSKVSLIFDSSIPGKKRSSGKERTPLSHLNQMEKLGNFSNDVSCDIEPSHHSPDGAADGSSLHIGVDKEKEVPPADTSLEKEVLPSDTPAEKEVPSADTPLEKPSSSMNDATPSLNKMDSETNDKASEKKPDLPSSDRSPGGEPVAVLEAATRKDRKRKPNFYNTDSQNKSRTDKGKRPADNTKKSGSKTSKSQKKRKRVNNQPSVTASDRNGKETVETQLNDELVSEEVGQPSDLSREAGKVVVEPLIYDTNDPGLQQVDKVLGCRVQVDNISHSHDIPGISANDPALGDSPREEVNDGKPSCDVPVVEVGKEYSGSGSQETLDIPDKGKSSKDDTTKDNMQVYRRSGSRECKEGTGTVKEDSQGSVSEGAINNREEDIAVNADDYLANKQNTSRESNDSTEKNYNDKGKSKGNVTSGTHEVGTGKGKNEMITADTTSFKKSEETVSATPSTSNSVNVVYEYLVKWVGKSNIHNSWIPESALKILAKRKLDNYKAKYGTATINICDEQWKLPQRIIATRPGTGGSDEVFVRWTGLPYDECTWEKIEEPVIAKSSHLINQFNQFESQALNRNATKDDVVRKRKECLKNDIVTLTEQPRELGGSLFPHQMEALNWLRKCWHKSKNVILADEMGLGKTISASAFLSSLYTEFNAALPSLVLVPLSTMPNWMAEFQLWAPHLNVVEYHGTAKARSVIRQFEWHARDRSDPSKRSTSYKFNVLLTTYEMILVDSSYLRGIPWEVLVVDEGHRLKNSSSKLFSMLNTFSFQHRVLLTGTPLQNNIGEMYNLLNFLQPSSFPSLSSFEEKFTDLTTAEKVEELKKLVAPHMLRRLKKDAMQNIPPKTERVVPVELTSIQAEYYRAMLTKNYQLLRNIGKGIAQQSMLNIVMQLRKVCNHPYLIPGTEPDSGSLEFLHEMRIKASGKLTLLHSMLKCLHKEGHRVLIFSQMTKLLDILEDYLAIEFGQKTYERVDGSVAVADRQAAIARFNQDKSRFVFLLSTRSCGLGINLATADTVIIYDSDFNPHADIQAMNRAHRIGQSKRLLVYRLVVRASVEERILQLAKRKLMLDQLFVNKSGSQKEVEDILRWGTEELFSDSSSMAEKDAVENSSNKDETVPEVEHKRKRTGSLGDVYKDKCTKGSTMIVWDENAILKLLDRSNLQSESPDNNEAELENDMLGSVKSLEWNEEGAEEQAGIASDMVLSEDTCVQNVEKKEDNLASSGEENEWDKLLRVRWEKYQSEEEAALGRGKRQRKAISYREAYASHPNETLSENTAEEEQEPVPVPEPEREYSQAGRALKEKYAKLRAKQKERLARRNEIGASGPVEGQAGRESPCHLLPPQAPYVNLINVPSQHREEKPLAMNLDNNSRPKSSETQKNMGDSTLRLGKLKHKLNDNIDFPSRGHPVADIPQSSKLAQDMSYVNSVNKQLLPVLGLCAPNAHQAEAPQRNLSKSNIRQHRQGLGLDFPTIAPPELSTEMVAKGLPRRFRLPDLPVDPSQQPPKSSLPGSYLPFNPHPRSLMRERGSVGNLKKSGATLSDIQDRTALPKPLDKPLLPRYPFPAMNMPRPSSGLLPNLRLGSRVADVNESVREHPVLPFLPNLKFPPHDAPRFNPQEQEMPPARGLGHMAPPSSSFPENHWKVLENIMLRTGLGSGSGSGSANLLKRRNKLDVWSEDELDCLWIGVRRHGRGNWDTMLRDPKLKFSKYRTPEDLSIRWEEEQLKIVDGPALPAPKSSKPTKVGKSGLFSGISDEMMARALHGCKLNGQLLPAHLTDMKLGFGNLPSSFPQLEPPERLGFNSQHISHLPTPSADKYQVNIPRDLNAGPSDTAGAPSSFLTESPFLLNSSGSSSLGPLGLGCQNKFDLQKENDDGASRSVKLPSLLDKPINISHDSRNNAGGRESSNYPSFPVLDKGQKVPQSKGKEVVESSSPRNKLPHWLREAVSTPAKPTEPDLPPTVTAIAQSVRMLYGEEKPPFIPPFVIPSPPPTQPRDPRLSLKKKKKKKKQQQHGLQAVRQFPIDFAGTIDVQGCNLHGESMAGTSMAGTSMAGTSILQDPAFPLLSRVMGRTSGLPSNEANLNMPPPSVNVNPSSSTFPLTKTSTGLSPSPEVLQLVASCVAPGPPVATGSSFLGNMASLPTSVDQVASSDSQDSHEKQEADRTLAPSTWVPFQEEKEVETDSRDSSKTQSDSARARQEHVEEMSSEGTVSDHQKDDHEP